MTFSLAWSNPVRQPNKNFGGTIGVAWDPRKNGKTVIRAGAGIYYENGVFNNVLFDRPGRLPNGLFNQVQEVWVPRAVCRMPDGSFVSSIDGLSIPTQICGDQNAVGTCTNRNLGPAKAVPTSNAFGGAAGKRSLLRKCADKRKYGLDVRSELSVALFRTNERWIPTRTSSRHST